MRLDKAIVTAEDILRYVEPGDPPDEHNALRLLIEAGKLIIAWRNALPAGKLQLLPEETEE